MKPRELMLVQCNLLKLQILLKFQQFPMSVFFLLQDPIQDPTLYWAVMAPYSPSVYSRSQASLIVHNLDTFGEKKNWSVTLWMSLNVSLMFSQN